MRFSVVICTYNRAEVLKGAILSLCQQSFDPEDYEIIVIDNASPDATPEVVQAFQQEYPHLAIQYWLEEQIGLSYARNRGYEIAQGEIIAYLDDDAHAAPDWLARADQILTQYPLEGLGGGAKPFYTTSKPFWFEDRYGTDRLTESPRFLTPEEPFIYGYNMMFPRALLIALGGFDPKLGMTGTTLAYAEETDLLKRIWQANPQAKLYYDPDLWVEHWVKPERMRLRDLCYQRFVQGRYIERLQQSMAHQSSGQLLLHGFKVSLLAGWRLVRFGWLARSKERYPYWQNFFYEQTLERCYVLGILYEAYRTS